MRRLTFGAFLWIASLAPALAQFSMPEISYENFEEGPPPFYEDPSNLLSGPLLIVVVVGLFLFSRNSRKSERK